MMKKNNEEEVLQVNCILAAQKEFPGMAATISQNYNNVAAGVDPGKASVIVRKEISKGLKPGRPDLSVDYNSRTYYIELKSEKGVLTKSQKLYIPILLRQKMPVFLARSVAEFLEILSEIKQEKAFESYQMQSKYFIKL